jgi:AhpD family alkylhydroperoxidase
VLEPRFDMLGNELGATIGKRIFNVNQAIEQSPLSKTVQELVMLRAGQINGCGWCIDIHTKEAAAAGEAAVRINLVALVALINATNRLAVIVNYQGGSYEPG